MKTNQASAIRLAAAQLAAVERLYDTVCTALSEDAELADADQAQQALDTLIRKLTALRSNYIFKPRPAPEDPWTVDPRWFDRTRTADDDGSMAVRVHRASGDELAMRRLVLRVHGRETLHNCILQTHGRAGRY